jgi:hypothetical protein
LVTERLTNGPIRIHVIAVEMGMSSYTLERRIAEQGPALSALHDKTPVFGEALHKK